MKDNPAQVSFDSKVCKFVIVDTLLTFSVRSKELYIGTVTALFQ